MGGKILIGYLIVGLIGLLFSILLFKDDFSVLYRVCFTLLMVVGFVLVYNVYGATYRTVVYLSLYTIMLVISAYDIKEQLVGNDILILGAVVGILLLPINRDYHLVNYILSGLGYMTLFAIISRVTNETIGMGDAYVLGIVGLFLGAIHTLGVLLFAVIIGGTVTLILFVLKIVGRKTTLPFIPFVTIGFMATILL